MKICMKFFAMALILGCFVLESQALAQSNANQSARNEQGNNWMMGGLSMAIGGAMMKASCHPGGWVLCAIGAAGAASGVQDIATGNGRSGSISATDATGMCPGGNCMTQGDSGGLGGSTLNGGPSGFSTDGLPQPVADAFTNAQNIAQQNGMDLTNPSTIDSFKKQNGVGGGGGGTPNISMADMPADVRAAVEKAKKDFLAKYHISSVGIDEGGGTARRRYGNSDGDNVDVNSLLAAMSGANSNRGPASVAGLQKTLGGDAIGVAADNIFMQVSRRYQAKMATKIFLPPPPLK